jgi:hypothetical protein
LESSRLLSFRWRAPADSADLLNQKWRAIAAETLRDQPRMSLFYRVLIDEMDPDLFS